MNNEKAEHFFNTYCTGTINNEEELIQVAISRSYAPSVLRALYDEKTKRHGFQGKINEKESAREAGKFIIKTALKELSKKDFDSQATFDDWAFGKWDEIRSEYHKNSITWYTYGNAQKWFNMAIKYFAVMKYCLQKEEISNLQYCHFPVDRIMIQNNEEELNVKFDGSSWSRCDNKEKLMCYIRKVRDAISLSSKYSSLSLFDYELETWSAR